MSRNLTPDHFNVSHTFGKVYFIERIKTFDTLSFHFSILSQPSMVPCCPQATNPFLACHIATMHPFVWCNTLRDLQETTLKPLSPLFFIV